MWVQNNCLEGLQESIEMFEQALQFFILQIREFKSAADTYLRQLYRQYLLIRRMAAKSTKRGSDILFESLLYAEKVKEA